MAKRRRRKKFLGLFGSRRGKSRRGGKMAARMRSKPKHCKTELGACMRARRGPSKCMKQYHACG